MDAAVVCLCGSMRFFDDMLAVASEETAAGRIVLAPFTVVAPDDQGSALKSALDSLHRAKIDLADEIIVVTRDGYIGESTRGEIAYAQETSKAVRYVDLVGVQ
jgi:multidrug resistance efflux pump